MGILIRLVWYVIRGSLTTGQVAIGYSVQPGHFPTYLSKLKLDSVGADFKLVRKLTNYIHGASLKLRLRLFRNIY